MDNNSIFIPISIIIICGSVAAIVFYLLEYPLKKFRDIVYKKFEKKNKSAVKSPVTQSKNYRLISTNIAFTTAFVLAFILILFKPSLIKFSNSINGIFVDKHLKEIPFQIDLPPLDALQHYDNGVEYCKKEDYKSAITEYSLAIQMSPNYLLFYNARGDAQYFLQNYEEAIADYDRAIQIAPNATLTYNNRAMAKAKIKDYKAAISDYDKAIKIAPDLPSYYNNRADAKYHIKDYKGAMSDYDKAIQIAPDVTSNYNNQADTKHHITDYKGAMADYNIAIHIVPNDADYYYNRAVTKEKSKDHQGAKADYKKACEMGNKHACEEYKKMNIAK